MWGVCECVCECDECVCECVMCVSVCECGVCVSMCGVYGCLRERSDSFVLSGDRCWESIPEGETIHLPGKPTQTERRTQTCPSPFLEKFIIGGAYLPQPLITEHSQELLRVLVQCLWCVCVCVCVCE